DAVALARTASWLGNLGGARAVVGPAAAATRAAAARRARCGHARSVGPARQSAMAVAVFADRRGSRSGGPRAPSRALARPAALRGGARRVLDRWAGDRAA